jgi:hypothetical protein
VQSKVIVININLLYEALNDDCCQPSSKTVNSSNSVILQTIEVKISNLNFEGFGRSLGLLRWESKVLFSDLRVYRRMRFSLTPQPLEKEEVLSFETSKIINPATQRNNSEDLNLKRELCKKLKPGKCLLAFYIVICRGVSFCPIRMSRDVELCDCDLI